MSHRIAPTSLAVAVALAIGCGMPAHGALPLVAGIGKTLLKDLLFDGVKSHLIGSLGGMGCKGAAVASLLSPGGVKRAAVQALTPSLPMAGMPQTLGMGMPAVPGAGNADTAQLMAQMQQMMAGRMGHGTMSPEAMAQMQAQMPALQQMLQQPPLSRAETITVFDELAELGVMTPAMQSELRDCLMLAPPGVGDSIGMSGAMLKNMVLPQLRAAREQMANLQPQEREQLANEMTEALKEASPEDRRAFLDGFGAGFFPRDVVDAVKAKSR
jgi:hypothetical protein